jgi:hypothetical protein
MASGLAANDRAREILLEMSMNCARDVTGPVGAFARAGIRERKATVYDHEPGTRPARFELGGGDQRGEH